MPNKKKTRSKHSVLNSNLNSKKTSKNSVPKDLEEISKISMDRNLLTHTLKNKHQHHSDKVLFDIQPNNSTPGLRR